MITEWANLGSDHSKTNVNMYIVYMDQFLTEFFLNLRFMYSGWGCLCKCINSLRLRYKYKIKAILSINHLIHIRHSL